MRKCTILPRVKHKLYIIKWQDAHSNSGWFTLNDLQKEMNNSEIVCETIGWIVYEDKSEVHVVSRRLEDYRPNEVRYEYGLYSRIPKAWIYSKYELKVDIPVKTKNRQ